jgi:LPXTG-motif cell wall-anchored protein
MTHHTPPATLASELRRLTVLELSRGARAGYVCLLLGASAMTAIVGALLLTEPSLPQRTSIALAVMVAMGLSWMGFAAWVLTRRRILLGKDRVVASRMAVTFSSLFVAGCVVAAAMTGAASAFAAMALGLLMLGVAAGLWIRARRQVEHLATRRQELERELAGLASGH